MSLSRSLSASLALLLGAGTLSCGELAVHEAGGAGRTGAAVAPVVSTRVSGLRLSAWSAPTALAAANTPDLEFPNAISKDGLSLYFQRGDAAARGEDLWVVRRPSAEEAWGAPEKLPDTINSAYNERAAYVSADGHWLFFASDRPGGRGGADLMVSWRQHTHAEAWEPAVNLDDLGGSVNSPGFDSGPALFQHDDGGDELYFVSAPAPGGTQAAADVYVSRRNPDGSFGAPALVPELSSAASDGRPYLSHNGLEIYLQSNRPGVGAFDLWTATRASEHEPWSAPELVAELDTATGSEVTPVLSWDGLTLFYGVGVPGTPGQIFQTTREKVHGKP